MDKSQIDELYHLLRCASNEKKTDIQAFSVQHLVYGLARHLLAGGDYPSLIQYSSWYGGRFLVDPTYEAIKGAGWKIDRVVELGAGTGWLGRALASKLGFLPTLFTDKRPWTMIDIVADLETQQGMEKVLSVMRDGDLIVAADLLHCLDDPKDIMSHFSKWPMAILEYCPTNKEYADSYSTQIRRYGATPIFPGAFAGMFEGRKADIVDMDPYILLLVEAGI